jgi:multisubunit Na+/H+ antiporter MnhC subunit
MLTTVIASATFAGLIGGFAVQKIFFTLAGVFVYLYLFLSVPGSFDISFSWIHENPWATVALVVGVAVGIALLIRQFWPKVVRWWEQAKEGSQVLTHPAVYFGRVFFPEFVAWAAGLCITAVFLAAYDIHTVMGITGSNSISNTVSLTPGGAGVNQAFNVAALRDVTDSQSATAYSVSQQLISTAWSIVMATVLLIWVFGWAGGKSLVSESYESAKIKMAEQKAAREAAKAGTGGQTQSA